MISLLFRHGIGLNMQTVGDRLTQLWRFFLLSMPPQRNLKKLREKGLGLLDEVDEQQCKRTEQFVSIDSGRLGVRCTVVDRPRTVVANVGGEGT